MAICSLISSALPWGDHLSDAGGVEDTAVWGGVMADEAVHHRPGSAVIDSAIRDVADMRKARFAMLCRSAVPRGPVCTENLIRVDDVMESAKLVE